MAANGGGANLIVNGSFEQGNFDYTGTGWSWNSVPAGDSTKVTGWTAAQYGFDWHRAVEFGPAFDGNMMVDLTYGSLPGGISQTFATVPSQEYTLTFALAGPDDTYGNPRKVNVSVAGDTASFEQAASPAVPGSTQPVATLVWGVETMSFMASDAFTTLTFTGDYNGVPWGPVIDDVKVESAGVPEGGTTLCLLAFGFALLAAFRRVSSSPCLR